MPSGLFWKVSHPISPLPGPCVLWKSFLLLYNTLLQGTLLPSPAAPFKLCSNYCLNCIYGGKEVIFYECRITHWLFSYRFGL